jgi:hypothetical protein
MNGSQEDSARRVGRSALLTVLALLAPLSYEMVCCPPAHDGCGCVDLRTGCDDCPGDQSRVMPSIREFTARAPQVQTFSLEPSAWDGALQAPLRPLILGPLPPSSLAAAECAAGRASPPLFVLFSSLVI